MKSSHVIYLTIKSLLISNCLSVDNYTQGYGNNYSLHVVTLKVINGITITK
jgi:hypothetical protein